MVWPGLAGRDLTTLSDPRVDRRVTFTVPAARGRTDTSKPRRARPAPASVAAAATRGRKRTAGARRYASPDGFIFPRSVSRPQCSFRGPSGSSSSLN